MAEGKTESAVAMGTACVADLAQLAEDDPLRVEALRRFSVRAAHRGDAGTALAGRAARTNDCGRERGVG